MARCLNKNVEFLGLVARSCNSVKGLHRIRMKEVKRKKKSVMMDEKL